MLGDQNYHVPQDILIMLCQVTLKNYFYAKLLKIQYRQAPNSSVYGCVSLGNKLRPRIQIMSADLPRQALAEKLNKSYPVCPLQRAGDHKQHSSTGTMTTPDALWEVEWTLVVAATQAASFITTTQKTKGHEGSPSDTLYW